MRTKKHQAIDILTAMITHGNQNARANPMTLAGILWKLSLDDVKYLHHCIASRIDFEIEKRERERK